MNIIKYFISILLIFVIKTNCSSYNHLDIQLALLILAAGDYKGNIVKDNGEPLTFYFNHYMFIRYS